MRFFVVIGVLFAAFFYEPLRANQFQEAYERLVETDLDLEIALQLGELQRHHIVIVPGFLSESFECVGTAASDAAVWADQQLIRAMRLAGREIDPHCKKRRPDFELQRSLFDQFEIPHSTVDIDSEAPGEENKQVIEEHLGGIEEPVIVLSHSKGGLDSLAAFIEWPDLSEKVAGWISLQSPFFGAELADEVVDNRFAPKILDPILNWMNGDFDAVVDLSIKTRIPYMEDHRKFIDQWMSEVPSIQIGSTIEGYPDDVGGLFAFTSDRYLKYEKINDGIVPLESCFIEGGNHLVLEGLDHSHLNRGKDKPGFSNKKFTQAILLLLLDKISSPDEDAEES